MRKLQTDLAMSFKIQNFDLALGTTPIVIRGTSPREIESLIHKETRVHKLLSRRGSKTYLIN